MSNVMVTTARNRYGHLIYVAGGLLLGFSIGVDVTRRFPREASWFGSPAFYIALALALVAAWQQKRQSE